jgi:hypothetical protein
MCVTMKPRRNEEAQAHIGLSSHTHKKYIYNITEVSVTNRQLRAQNQLHLFHAFFLLAPILPFTTLSDNQQLRND